MALHVKRVSAVSCVIGLGSGQTGHPVYSLPVGHSGGRRYLHPKTILGPMFRRRQTDSDVIQREENMFTLRDVLDMAIQIERNGESVYRDALARMEDPDLVEMLTWMADEEARHANHFVDIRQRLTLEVENALMDELGKLMLESIVGNRSFSLEEVDFTKVEEVNDLLKIMIAFEKDTIRFYQLIRDLMADTAEQEWMDGIIDDEEQHIMKLEECRDKNLACHKQ